LFIYLLIIVELATCFDPAGSSSRLCANQVMLKMSYSKSFVLTHTRARTHARTHARARTHTHTHTHWEIAPSHIHIKK